MRRRFTLHHLRNFGFGKSATENIIMEEVHKIINKLECTNEIEAHHYFFISVLNVTWSIVGGIYNNL